MRLLTLLRGRWQRVQDAAWQRLVHHGLKRVFQRLTEPNVERAWFSLRLWDVITAWAHDGSMPADRKSCITENRCLTVRFLKNALRQL